MEASNTEMPSQKSLTRCLFFNQETYCSNCSFDNVCKPELSRFRNMTNLRLAHGHLLINLRLPHHHLLFHSPV